MLFSMVIFTGFAAVFAGTGMLCWHGRATQLYSLYGFMRMAGSTDEKARVFTARMCWGMAAVFAMIPPVLAVVQGHLAWLWLVAAVDLLLASGGMVLWRWLSAE